MKLKISATILAATAFSLSFVAAAPADAAEKVRQGFVRCGANNFLRANSTEVHTIAITLRNFDATQPITISRLRILNSTGVVLFDSTASGLPPFDNGLLGPATNVLSPNNSSTVLMDSFVPYQAQVDRPLQMFVNWSSANPALPLGVGATRLVRERDLSTGAHLAERSRNSSGCQSILVP
jgi:hypothetical protein